jgi:nitrogen regulatory protein PII
MKMFFIIYSSVADEGVIDAFKKAGIREYTKMKEVHGEGTETEPKLGTHIWPGANNALFVAVSDEKVSLITNIIKSVKISHPRSGIKGFILPMEECV